LAFANFATWQQQRGLSFSVSFSFVVACSLQYGAPFPIVLCALTEEASSAALRLQLPQDDRDSFRIKSECIFEK